MKDLIAVWFGATFIMVLVIVALTQLAYLINS